MRKSTKPTNDPVAAGFTDAQVIEAVRRKLVSFEDFLTEIQKENIIDEKHDVRFFMNVDRLIRELFIWSKEGKHIGMMRACKLIPAQHVDTCKKYIKEAEQRGIILTWKNEPGAETEGDGRQRNVQLTDRFMTFIDQKAREKLSIAMAIAGGASFNH